MKLFVWANPYPISYGTSAFFAVAETVEEARHLAMNAPAYAFVEIQQRKSPSVQLGEPTRIVDLPCAEWHEWSE